MARGASRFAAVQALEKYGWAGAAQPQETEAGTACLCKTMSMVLRDCSHDPLNCERILLLMLATADMVGQTRTCPAERSRGAPSHICDSITSENGLAMSQDSE